MLLPAFWMVFLGKRGALKKVHREKASETFWTVIEIVKTIDFDRFSKFT